MKVSSTSAIYGISQYQRMLNVYDKANRGNITKTMATAAGYTDTNRVLHDFVNLRISAEAKMLWMQATKKGE